MKVGDYVGWAYHEKELDPAEEFPAGIILEEKQDHRAEWGEKYTEFLILQHNGELSWEFGSDLVVIHESR